MTTDHRKRTPSISCVVPCRNEAKNLELLIPMVSRCLAQITEAWELILVDDGSTDCSPVLLQGWSTLPGLRVLQLSRTFGKEAALTAGLEAASGEVVITMDADLQHSPFLIPHFIHHWQQGADVAYAVREHRQDESQLKRLGAHWFYTLLKGADRFDIPAGAGDFRLMDRRVVHALLALPERNRFMKGLYAWVGFKAVAVPYMPAQRHHGKTHFNLFNLIRLSLDGLTSFTTWPLRFVSFIGFVLALLAFVYGGYLTASYLFRGHVVGGWTTIMVSVMLFSGIQLMSLGIVGEYIGRIFEEVKGRPLFIIQRQMGKGLNPSD